MPLLDGIKLNLGGRDYVVPPLNLKALRRLAPKISGLQGMGNMPNDAEIDAVVEIVHSAIARNYPDLTLDDLEGILDMANLKPVLLAVLQGSGLTPSAAGEAGESRGSTGPASTGS